MSFQEAQLASAPAGGYRVRLMLSSAVARQSPGLCAELRGPGSPPGRTCATRPLVNPSRSRELGTEVLICLGPSPHYILIFFLSCFENVRKFEVAFPSLHLWVKIRWRTGDSSKPKCARCAAVNSRGAAHRAPSAGHAPSAEVAGGQDLGAAHSVGSWFQGQVASAQDVGEGRFPDLLLQIRVLPGPLA